MNLIVSIIYKKLWKQLFWLYFIFTIVIEISITVKASFISDKWYNYLDIFCIVYFGYIFIKEINNYIIKIITLFFFIIGIISIFYSKDDSSYYIVTGYLYCIFLILISLYWLYKKISSDYVTKNILDNGFFWLSCSLLFWSPFYIFRMYPMYYFNKVDVTFLTEIAKIFTFINIITYLLFMKALFCIK